MYTIGMYTHDKTGILLLNLGGPQTQEEVEPFLVNLFSDRQIIRLGPPFLQRTIAKFIARRRAPKSKANYQRIGGGSPILQKTQEQALALETALNHEGDAFVVRPCMRYWHPMAKQVLQELREAKVNRILALPLYPHYSIATTGSSVTDLKQTKNELNLTIPLHIIHAWPEQTDYIACLAERIKEGQARFQGEQVDLLYSAHSLPVQFIREGDPYVDDLHKTIAALEQRTGLAGSLCYQSRSGPVEWLGPALPDVIKERAEQGSKNILVLPLSFVSDHVETLYEIDIEYRALAESLGLRFASTRALNDDPLFIRGLQTLVTQKLQQHGEGSPLA